MLVLDGGDDRRREGAVSEVNSGCPVVTNRDGDALFPNYFGEDLLLLLVGSEVSGICRL